MRGGTGFVLHAQGSALVRDDFEVLDLRNMKEEYPEMLPNNGHKQPKPEIMARLLR